MIEERATTADTSGFGTATPRESKHNPNKIKIACPRCGNPFSPLVTGTNVCPTCISSKQDISDGITKQAIINFCRNCRRYLNPPWIYCERESKELLSICLKKIKGLNRVKLEDARFKWTEPHSKRINVELTVTKEVAHNTAMKQSFDVEFIENYMQCDDCKKIFTPHTWKSQVQVRQRAEHKKTFLYLEQIMLRAKVHDKATQIKEIPEGLDFYFTNRNHSTALVNFLQSNVPHQFKESKELVSHDVQTSIYNYKYTYLLEMPKICKDDLVVLPRSLCKELGGVNPLGVCIKVTNCIHLYDPVTLKTYQMNAGQYFNYENDIDLYQFRGRETEYMVVGVEADKEHASKIHTTFNNFEFKFAHIDVQVPSTGQVYFSDCHFGNILKHGDMVLGYDINSMSVKEDLEIMGQRNIPDVVLIRKQYPEKFKKRKIWKLQRMNIEKDELQTKGNKTRKTDKDKDKDMDEFLEELEQNKALRSKINLIRVSFRLNLG